MQWLIDDLFKKAECSVCGQNAGLVFWHFLDQLTMCKTYFSASWGPDSCTRLAMSCKDSVRKVCRVQMKQKRILQGVLPQHASLYVLLLWLQICLPNGLHSTWLHHMLSLNWAYCENIRDAEGVVVAQKHRFIKWINFWILNFSDFNLLLFDSCNNFYLSIFICKQTQHDMM